MSANLLRFLWICGVVTFPYVLCQNYKLVDIEIKKDSDGNPLKVYTPEDIAEFDGSKSDKPIYLAIRGVVFDVSKGKGFYSTGSDYQVLAGKDASRAHALWSLDPKDLTHDLSGLTDEQLRGLDQVYEGTYLPKYPVVGYMSYLIEQQQQQGSARAAKQEKNEL